MDTSCSNIFNQVETAVSSLDPQALAEAVKTMAVALEAQDTLPTAEEHQQGLAILYRTVSALQSVLQDSTIDSLTGLPNRRAFDQALDTKWAALKRNDMHNFALVFMDLDGFKAINDTFSHEAGNHVLQEAAQRLRGKTRQEDMIFRYGGDEFVILMPVKDKENFSKITIKQHLRDSLEGLALWKKDIPYPVSASIGIAVSDNNRSVSDLLPLADARMYKDKHGKNTPQEKTPPSVLSALFDNLRWPCVKPHLPPKEKRLETRRIEAIIKKNTPIPPETHPDP